MKDIFFIKSKIHKSGNNFAQLLTLYDYHCQNYIAYTYKIRQCCQLHINQDTLLWLSFSSALYEKLTKPH